MTEYTNVRISLEDRIAVLTIDHPPVNTLSRATLADLNAALDEVIASEVVKVIIIAGAGQSAFVAGADIAEIAALKDEGDAREFIRMGREVFDKIESCPKPVIAAIHAAALGGGMELAMACHIRILSDRARLGQLETNLGIIPGWGGTQQLPRIVGRGKATELILTGDIINAQEAFRLGLANRVTPPDQVLAEARELAQKLAAKSKLTNEAALRAISESFKLSPADGLRAESRSSGAEADQFAKLIGSNDAKEGTSAFLQKRQPKFTDS